MYAASEAVIKAVGQRSALILTTHKAYQNFLASIVSKVCCVFCTVGQVHQLGENLQYPTSLLA